MIAIYVIYPRTQDSRFDSKYYNEVHGPLVCHLLYPMGMRILRVSSPAVPDQSTHLIAALVFDDLVGAQAALARHGAELQADVAPLYRRRARCVSGQRGWMIEVRAGGVG